MLKYFKLFYKAISYRRRLYEVYVVVTKTLFINFNFYDPDSKTNNIFYFHPLTK